MYRTGIGAGLCQGQPDVSDDRNGVNTMVFIESLTYGQMDYQPAEDAGLKAICQPLKAAPSIREFQPVMVSITNEAPVPWQGIIRIGHSLPTEETPFFLLPGFMVGTNRGDAPLVVDSKCPRLRKSPTEFPASPWWMVRGDRVSHPVAIVYAAGYATGLCGDVTFVHQGATQYAGFGCDIDRSCVYYTLGWENAPWLFIQSHNYSPREIREEQCITLEPGETITTRINVIDASGDDVRCVHQVIRSVYSMYHQPPRQGVNVKEAVKLLAEAIDHDAWMDDQQAYAGFVFDRSDHLEFRPLPSTSWTNGLSAAMPVLLAAHRLNDQTMRNHALTIIQNIVEHSMNEASGLPWTVCDNGVWSNRGWWYDRLPVPGHTGYLVGQTLYSILRAYEAELATGTAHADWLSFVELAMQKVETTTNGDGEYPYVMSEKTGAGLCYDSMSGVWCLAAAAYLRTLTGNQTGLYKLLASEAHYYHHYVEQVCCYGGPLDIDKQIDSEGVLAYMRAVRRLHQLTGKSYLLEHLRDALEYEFTFKFCYNSPIQVPPLSRGWSSCGGSVTSVANPHIHPMSSTVVDEMLYYLSHQKDAYIRSRLNDTVAWGLQTFARYDREYDYGKAGWMSERFCYSQGLLTERYPDGNPASTWFALMPWAIGCLLEGFCGEYWSFCDADNQ